MTSWPNRNPPDGLGMLFGGLGSPYGSLEAPLLMLLSESELALELSSPPRVTTTSALRVSTDAACAAAYMAATVAREACLAPCAWRKRRRALPLDSRCRAIRVGKFSNVGCFRFKIARRGSGLRKPMGPICASHEHTKTKLDENMGYRWQGSKNTMRNTIPPKRSAIIVITAIPASTIINTAIIFPIIVMMLKLLFYSSALSHPTSVDAVQSSRLSFKNMIISKFAGKRLPRWGGGGG
jgi:hypothetical protein